MSGTIDHTLAERRGHVCNPPRIMTFQSPQPPSKNWTAPAVVLHHPAGTRFHCDCGTTWVVWNRPAQVGVHIVVVGGLEWREETRRERRQRLGLRWWQWGRGLR